MARIFLENSINEGFNNVGTIEVDVTEFEVTKGSPDLELPSVEVSASTSLLFKLEFSVAGSPSVPSDYRALFTVSAADEEFEYTLHPDLEGYIELKTPLLPIVTLGDINDDYSDIIRVGINGPLTVRPEESYMKLEHPTLPETYLYTLISDYAVYYPDPGMAGYLTVYDGDQTYYKIFPEIPISSVSTAIYITNLGKVYEFDSVADAWSFVASLNFTKITDPTGLESYVDGFYMIGATSEEDDGPFGDVPFPDHKATVKNPQPYFINVGVEVYEPEGVTPLDITPELFSNKMQGGLNYSIITIDGTLATPEDTYPMLSHIAALSGAPDLTEITAFLTDPTRELNTLKKIRNAGPITYLEGFDDEDPPIPQDQVDYVQAHVDLYAINPNITQNKYIITSGYGSLYKIATTAKNQFLDDIVGGAGLTLFHTAKVHEIVQHGYKLSTNLLAGILNDAKQTTPSISGVDGSTFHGTATNSSSNNCECSDCKSMVSQFSYLFDLLKYGSEHIDHSPTSYSHASPNTTTFSNLLETKFYQPFGTLNVDCNTLHQEFCRVRLVTEVLEAKVTAASISTSTLTNDRNQYLLLAYSTILNLIGTSVNEIRDIYVIQNNSDKLSASQKLVDRLGLPLYKPGTSNLVTDAMWLALTGSGTPLTAANLETVFGFRDTKKNVLLNLNPSLYEGWQSAYLRDIWKKTDYYFSPYSRENVDPNNNTTFKSNWQPIIDPDIMGWEDITYNSSQVAIDLYKLRKQDTDDFLSYCLTNANVVSRTSADMNGRILRVLERDLTSYTFEDDLIWLENPSTSTWDPFTILQRKLDETNTVVTLLKTTPSLAQPAMFQPAASTPKLSYRKVLDVVNLIGTSSVSLDWPDAVFNLDDLWASPFYIKLTSWDGTTLTTYETPSTSNPSPANSISSINYSANNQVSFTCSPSLSGSFLSGEMKYVFEQRVSLYTDLIVDPLKLVTKLFTTNNFVYNILTPNNAGLSNLNYTIWDVPSNWQGLIGTSNYNKLIDLYSRIIAGTATDLQVAIIVNNLHMSTDEFTRLMKIFTICDNYLAATFNSPRPSNEELYEAASILRNAGKFSLRDLWVKEEIKYKPTSGSNPTNLMLSLQNFWRSLEEPVTGSWDTDLQTIPATVGAIDPLIHRPIIDPELLDRKSILINPQAKPYLDLYDARKAVLDAQLSGFHDPSTWGAFGVNIFTKILNYVQSGNNATAYTISPYASLLVLRDDLNDSDAFKKSAAIQKIWSAFKLTPEDFITVVDTKEDFESGDPSRIPDYTEMDTAFRILVSAFKRNLLYPGYLSVTGWISEEIAGSTSFTTGYPVKYYNVIKMRMAQGRSSRSYRADWQRTLEKWNRCPFIHPDIMLPENVKNFITSNWVYTKWNSRKAEISTATTTLQGIITPTPNDASTLFTKFKEQLNILVARVDTYTPIGGLTFLPYFTDLVSKEQNGENIVPYLDQLCITVEEYRFLSRIYSMLEVLVATSPSATPPLLDGEKKDLTDIFIHIHSVFKRFAQVQEEYAPSSSPTLPIILCSDKFQLYQSKTINFPQNTLPAFNSWRSLYSDRKNWTDILLARIEQEATVKDKWKKVLDETEDRNLPVMRDALIKALMVTCESFEQAAERLAKTYFIETKDNCCVKHTRVSFAIETIQGLIFALQNGVYDDFVSNFKLVAPKFEEEWRWLRTYEDWRSAALVFIYPENILYPTLKRLQSPAFSDLSVTINDLNGFSAEQACVEAKKYQDYFEDIHNLDIICSTNTIATVFNKDLDLCCGGAPKIDKSFTFYFAQSRLSGNCYWSRKEFNDTTQDALSFWEKIEIPHINVKVLGCYRLGRKSEGKDYLWLFYTFYQENKLKLGYLKKNMSDPMSTWSSGVTSAPPIYDDDVNYTPPNTLKYEPVAITACQQVSEDLDPGFIFTYKGVLSFTGQYRHVFGNYYPKTDTFYIWGKTSVFHANNIPSPVTTIKHSRGIYPSVTMVFDSYVVGFYNAGNYQETIFPNSTSTNPAINVSVSKIIGAFEQMLLNQWTNTTVVVYRDTSNNIKAVKLNVNGNNLLADAITNNNINTPIKKLNRIYPFFSETLTVDGTTGNFKGYYPAQTVTNKLLGVYLNVRKTTHSINLSDSGTYKSYRIAPERTPQVLIQSSECGTNLQTRRQDITTNMNLVYAVPTDFTDFIHMNAIQEYINEGYYFVPMLLALNLQRRGQFTAALSWYRTIYDYTGSTNRKIFYGLVKEEIAPNSFDKYIDWLLDPLNPHRIASGRTNAYTKYTVMNIIQCLFAYADREFTLDTIESVPISRKLYTVALDLLKSSGIMLAGNQCVSSVDCINTSTDMEAARMWSTTYNALMDEVISVGNAAAIDALVITITGIFSGSTEDTNALCYAEAFEAVQTAKDNLVVAPQNIETMLDQFKQDSNDAFSYLFATADTSEFYSIVGENYGAQVAEVSGVSVADVGTAGAEGQIGWLYDPTPSNDTTLIFSFADESGNQNLPDPWSYNPVSPSASTYKANSNYSGVGVSTGTGGVSFTPMISFNFCMPINPVYKSLELKGNLELYKIFNCRNIAGMVRELDVYSADADSVTGIPTLGITGSLTVPGFNNFAPSQYRFKVLIERAKLIASQAQQMETLFLAALQKEDDESYNQLIARQNLETANGTVKLQELRIIQANDESVVASMQLDKVTFLQNHFSKLLSKGLSNFEKMSLNHLENSYAQLNDSVNLQEANMIISGIVGTIGAILGGGGSGATSL